MREIGILFEDPFFERDGARFGVEQPNDALGPRDIRDVEMQKTQITLDDPERFVLCWQDADAARRAAPFGVDGGIRAEST